MIKTSRLALVWIALFIATFTVRKLTAAQGPERKANPEQEARVAMAELESQPRRTNPLSLNMSAAANDDGIVGSRLDPYLREHETELRVCRSVIMLRSARPSEYFEVSFVLEPEEGSTAGDRVADVVLERSSLQVTPLERACIERAFHNFVLPRQAAQPAATSDPSRSFYRFCFRTLARASRT